MEKELIDKAMDTLTETNTPSTPSPEKIPCEECGGFGRYNYTELDEQFNKYLCDECKSKHLAKRAYEKKLLDMKNDPEKYLKRVGVTEHHLDKSFENFEGNKKLVDLLRQFANQRPIQKSLLLTGSCGSGKTHIAVAILREFVMAGCETSKLKFINVPELLLELRSSFKDNYDRYVHKPTEEEILDKYASCKLLVLDDLGAEKSSEWVISSLYLLIDRRYRNNLPFIVTTNLSMTEIEEKLGSRIASRLCESQIIKIDMPDYRKRR